MTTPHDSIKGTVRALTRNAYATPVVTEEVCRAECSMNKSAAVQVRQPNQTFAKCEGYCMFGQSSGKTTFQQAE